MNAIIDLCLESSSKNPIEILEQIMELPFCHMHEPEHHVMVGNPRCCKRASFLSILSTVHFVEENFGISMEKPEVICRYSSENHQCIGKKCPFAQVNH